MAKAPATKPKTKNYIITKFGVCLKGTEETPVGEKVMLTDDKAASLIGKVRLLKDYEDEQNADKNLIAENKKLAKENAELGGVNADLTEQLGKLTEQLTAGKAK